LTKQNKQQSLIWHTEKRKVKELLPCSYNPRSISSEQKKQLIKSLQKFNLAEIPAVNTDNQILAGHQRIAVLITLGRGEEVIDVRIPNRKLTKQEADEYMLRSNLNTGDWDFSILGKDFNFDFLKNIGFPDFDLDKIFERKNAEDDFDAQKEYEKIKTPQSKRGDIYILGQHRLMCGDSTSETDFDKLMDGRKAALIFTDSPYNVNYKSAAGYSYNSKKFGGTGGKIFNDNLSDTDCINFYSKTLQNLYKHSSDNVTIYWWYALNNYELSAAAFRASDFYISQTIIWLKNSPVLSHGQNYHRVYEPCLVGWKNKKKSYQDKKLSKYQDIWLLDKESFAEHLDVWYEKRDNTAKYLHPTQKPVRLSERALKRNSKSGDIVIDAFGGSGSTLIGAQQLNRRCFVMELDPKYCDVIVKRWELFTNQRAKKIEGKR
jgi:DNA modification methylase